MRVGITPAQVDELELWQVAALLGLDLEPETNAIEERMEREAHTLAARAAALRQRDETPAVPESAETGEPVDITAQVMRQMGIRTP